MLRIVAKGLIVLVIIAAGGIFALQAPSSWSVGEVIRTPDDRFANLPDYPFEPNYIESLGYRVHYIDEGPKDGEVILLMHGQPSWSYLYRHMIPPLAENGYRVIVPDLVGFGKSDKPLEQSDHTYQMHVDVMTTFLRDLELQSVTLFAQDWGGLIGLRMVAEEPERFARIMLSNTGLPAASGVAGWMGYPLFRIAVWREGEPDSFADDDGFEFTRWVAWARSVPNFDYDALFQSGTTRELSPEELAGYTAPFPDEAYQAAPRVFPYMLPSQLRQNGKAMREVFANWDKPFLTAFSDSDPVTAGLDAIWLDTVPGSANQPHTTIKDGAHFVQEDQPEDLVQLLIQFIEQNAQ